MAQLVLVRTLGRKALAEPIHCQFNPTQVNMDQPIARDVLILRHSFIVCLLHCAQSMDYPLVIKLQAQMGVCCSISPNSFFVVWSDDHAECGQSFAFHNGREESSLASKPNEQEVAP